MVRAVAALNLCTSPYGGRRRWRLNHIVEEAPQRQSPFRRSGYWLRKIGCFGPSDSCAEAKVIHSIGLPALASESPARPPAYTVPAFSILLLSNCDTAEPAIINRESESDGLCGRFPLSVLIRSGWATNSDLARCEGVIKTSISRRVAWSSLC